MKVVKKDLANNLRIAVRVYYDNQAMRITMGNRLKITKAGDKQTIPEEQKETWFLKDKDREFFQSLYDEFSSREKEVEKYLKKELEEYPIYTNYLKQVKGVGVLMASVIISEYDIRIAETVSKMWAFTGLVPGRDKLIKGEKASFNKRLRAKMCGVLGPSFLKCNSPYREYYDNMKARYENEERWKDETSLHRHRAATRYMIKMFLKDLYVAWREIEGLPVREPYAEEYLGKKHIA